MKHADRDSFAIGTHSKVTSFDFDAWLKLAQSDLEAFEQKRSMVIDDFISNKNCRDDSLIRMRERIELQRNKRSIQDVLPWLMKELANSFGQLNKEFAARTLQRPE